ncbi:hypothetical protein EV663_101193 [Rhodovulum bhavnagarense]|uniref:Uncharacterized protein n=1 Tax=Rhodovulum bhavnagarense TaxID=992286 RepID=A0A4R2RSR5_9RHOB|nr:DUF6476 family protein [Rhodovulum bhavnagarense]TCP62931.1 hypothetical protein EV663_101193 [Rhodovulum bhavnagarense]
MNETPETEDLPPNLKLLRTLVTLLMVTMIGGFLVIVALFVIRMPGGDDALPLPDSLVLPEGAQPMAFTRGRDWVAVVTGDDRILIYDATTGDLRQTIVIAR